MCRTLVVVTALVAGLDAQTAPSVATRPGAVQTPPRDQRGPAPRGTGQVKGIVVDVDSGQPIRRASVSLFVKAASGESPSYATVSDGDGRFALGDLPAGELHLSARHEAYYDPRDGRGPAAPVLGDGQAVDGVRLSLRRTTAIAGRILDEYGEPAVGVGVRAIRLADASGREAGAFSGPGGTVTTDDTGAFRTWGLRPGRYLVSADPGNRVMGGGWFGGANTRRDGHAPTYYPGTPDSATAGQIVVRAGQDTTGVTFALITARLASIRGTLLTPEGVSPRGLNVMVSRVDPLRSGGAQSGRSVEGDGAFEIRNLAPGTYRLSAQETAQRERVAVMFGETQVEVNGDDLEGVVVSMKRTGRITGRVIADGALLPPGNAVNVMARPASDTRGWSGPFIRPTETRADGSFVIEGAYGRVTVSASVSTRPTASATATPPQTQWQLEAVRLDGRDITDEPIEIDERDVAVEIALTSQITHVGGRVTWDRRASSLDQRPVIVVFPDDPERWTTPSRWIRTSIAGDDGRFDVQGLPPGDGYLAVAVEGGPLPSLTSRAVLETLRPAGTPFDLPRGVVPELSLRAVSPPQP